MRVEVEKKYTHLSQNNSLLGRLARAAIDYVSDSIISEDVKREIENSFITMANQYESANKASTKLDPIKESINTEMWDCTIDTEASNRFSSRMYFTIRAKNHQPPYSYTITVPHKNGKVAVYTGIVGNLAARRLTGTEGRHMIPYHTYYYDGQQFPLKKLRMYTKWGGVRFTQSARVVGNPVYREDIISLATTAVMNTILGDR